jgi:hypothetical protein
MRDVRFGILASASFAAAAVSIYPIAAEERQQQNDEISAEGFLAIQKSLPELKARGINLRGYRIYVEKTNGLLVVSFVNPEVIQGLSGSTGMPGFSVILSEDGEHVERAFYHK